MCGLTGFINATCQMDADSLHAAVGRMTDTMRHRGPDDRGIWVDAAAGIALGFRRLAIVDLSAEGRQPMRSASGRYTVVFNGEIYNHRALRRELEGQACDGALPFRGHSDTEVMLAAFERWGIEAAVQRFVGMFAFALWDRHEHTLILGRDRIGEKPLYYGWMGDSFLFGSELKALVAHTAFRREINRDALTASLRYGYIPAPSSIYQGVAKLLPGTLLRLVPSDRAGRRWPVPAPYWSARDVAEAGGGAPFEGDMATALDELDLLLRDAVNMQMVADVPLGAFLSGGIDSSTIVALMQAQSTRPVKTFTIGFNESGYNEATHAKAVARHLGTDHTELYVTSDEAMDVIPYLPMIYDEPFADQSQIPTFLVSRLARSAVNVSLSGDGGDELFAGYDRYFWAERVWKRIGWMPNAARRGAAGVMAGISPPKWDQVFGALRPVLPSPIGHSASGHRMHRLAQVVRGAESSEGLYRHMISSWDGMPPVIGGSDPFSPLTDRDAGASLSAFTQRMKYLDLLTYLPDDILVKVDRASMAVSLESRAPFLDHRVVEFTWRLPLSMQVGNGQGKWVLRRLLDRYVPRELVERPKMGFGVPIGEWLRGPLRDWAEDLLAIERLREEGFIDPEPVRQKWNEHLSGARNWHLSLWNVLMVQAWLAAE